jgi:hypothetical protein
MRPSVHKGSTTGDIYLSPHITQIFSPPFLHSRVYPIAVTYAFTVAMARIRMSPHLTHIEGDVVRLRQAALAALRRHIVDEVDSDTIIRSGTAMLAAAVTCGEREEALLHARVVWDECRTCSAGPTGLGRGGEWVHPMLVVMALCKDLMRALRFEISM